MNDDTNAVRRNLLVAGGVALGGMLAARADAEAHPNADRVDEGTVLGEQITFPPIQADTERPGGGPRNPEPPNRRVGFAVMGLGRLALENILPAFAQCKHAKPVALVGGDAEKMHVVARQYGIPAAGCYSYSEFHKIRANRTVDVVYVVLPNALHHDAVIQSAAAGKHVLCEKPMAVSTEEGRSMVDACRAANRKLMIAYRCQYEVYNSDLARRARARELGRIQVIDAVNTQNQGNPAQWRQVKALAGGGSLPDVGLYCLNTSRALLGEEPVEVNASIFTLPDDPRFKEVEGTMSFSLRFPSGVMANCLTSYSVHEYRNLRVMGDKATGEIANAFGYSGQTLRIYRREGLADGNSQFTLPERNQFSLEIDHMARCVREDKTPRTPGEEGVQDHLIMAALYESARTGRAVRMPRIGSVDAFRGPQPSSY